MLGLGLGLNKQNSNALGSVPPYRDDALHYSPIVIDTTRPDRTGIFDRTSVMSRMAVGHASGTYIRFVDFVSTALTYYDIVLGTEVVTATDVNGDFVLPLNGIAYIDISGNRWIFEEITNPIDNNQTTFYDTSGTYEAQAFLTHAGWVANSVHGVANSDQYGVTIAGALGKNLFNKGNVIADNKVNNADGTLNGSVGNNASEYIVVSPGGSYKASNFVNTPEQRHAFYDSDRVYISGANGYSGTLVAPANSKYLRLTVGNLDLDTFQLELGTSATTYEEWEGYYKDETHTIPYADGQPLHALDNGDGTFSRQFCKAWLDTGAHGVLDSVGRLKHQVTRTDVAGTPDASGDYIKLAQDYPLVQSADLADTLVDDHTLDEPTNAVVAVATLDNVTGNQIFATKNSGDLLKLLVYDREMTLNEVGRIGAFLGISEVLFDSDSSVLTDDGDDVLRAYKTGITWE